METVTERTLFGTARACIDECDPQRKLERTAQVVRCLNDGALTLQDIGAVVAIDEPGRPGRPLLVHPRKVPRRRLGSIQGRAGLLHALAHIEFNAINLAWDAVYRFRGMPRQYYFDWAQVAAEEAFHFRLLSERLEELGFSYGQFDAHNGLWEMACKTAHDPLVRMALVPRVLEARGLDVSPGLIERLGRVGDVQSVSVLEIILRDEIGHVEIGSRWYHYLCEQRNLDPAETFRRLLDQYMKGHVKGPFDYAARYRAGFDQTEMQQLEILAAGDK